MLIPEFKLQQTDQFIIVIIRVPYVKVTACQFYIQPNMFKFYLKPYLLSLSFDQPLKESEQPAKATYFHEKHLLEVSLLKQNKGQFFQNLNLLSNIISKKEHKNKKQKKVLVEVVDEPEHKVLKKKEEKGSIYGYGFSNNYTKVFKDLDEEAFELFSFNPEDTSTMERYQLSRKIVFEEFDENSYMFDKISNFDEIDRVIESQAPIQEVLKGVKDVVSKSPENGQKFRNTFKIPSKQLLYHQEDQPNILKQLLSIAISYIYELYCMEGQMGVESAKTINSSCGVFNCFLNYEEVSIELAAIDSIRRCIVYSLYKHIDIGFKVMKLIEQNLNINFLLYILTNLRTMFDKSQPRYLLNRIFVDDFCIYLMDSKLEEELQELKGKLKGLKLSEESLELDIVNNEELEISNVAQSNGNTLGLELQEMLQFD